MGQSFHPGGQGETQPHRVDFQEQRGNSNKTVQEPRVPDLVILKYNYLCSLLLTLITVAGPIALKSILAVRTSKLALCPQRGLSWLGQFPVLWGSEELNR